MYLGKIKQQKDVSYQWQKKAYGNRWRSSGEFDNLVFITSLGSPVIRNVVKAINFQEAIEALQYND